MLKQVQSHSDSALIEIIDLHPNELQLIRNLRTGWRFGEVTILMRDGLPFRIRRITEFADLDTSGRGATVK